MNSVFCLSRRTAVFLAVVLAVMLLVGCGKEPPPKSPLTDYGNTGQAESGQPLILPAEGFSYQMTAGFGIRAYKPADIMEIYGQPYRRDDADYSNEVVVTLEYPGALFQFDAGSGDDSTLFFVQVSDSVIGPNGIKVGMDLFAAADAIFAGSGEMIAGTADYQLDFYGEYGSDDYGRYEHLEEEWASSDFVYQLIYSAPVGDGHKVLFSMAFNAARVMTEYSMEIV